MWRRRLHLTIQPRMWAMTLSTLRTRRRFTQILLVGCGSRNHFDIFWGSDTNNGGSVKYKVIFTISPQGDIFFQVQPKYVFKECKAFQRNGTLLYKNLIIHMDEPGSQNNVDSASFQNELPHLQSYIKRSVLFLSIIFKEKLGKHHSWF